MAPRGRPAPLLLALGALVLGVCGSLGGCTVTGGGRDPEAGVGFDAGPDADLDAGRAPPLDPCAIEGPGATLGDDCTGDQGCDDLCFCNGVEVCEEGVCVAGEEACLDELDCTADACLEELDQCFFEPIHARCSDGDACNGAEICDRRFGGCRPGEPLYCNDESACTIDACDPEAGCVHRLRDLDGDGHIDALCGGDDCDDDPRYGAEIYPGHEEVCTNRRDDDCDGDRDFRDEACLPENDRCEEARLLEVEGTHSGSTRGLARDLALRCGPSGPDAVFRIHLEEAHDLRLSLSSSEAGIALRRLADCATPGSELKCASGLAPSILARSLPAGDYAVIVSTERGEAFDLAYRLLPPTPVPPVDACDGGTLTIAASGIYAGLYEEVNDLYPLLCHPSTASFPEGAYALSIGARSDVTLTASSITASGILPLTYLSLTEDCADLGRTLQCTGSTAATLRRRSLDPGTYYVLVEPSLASATEWSLEADIRPAAPIGPGDACLTALDITGVIQSLSWSDLSLDHGTSCTGDSGGHRDAVFYFDLSEPRDVTLITQSPSEHFATLSGECGVAGSELRCRGASGTNEQLFRSLPAGRYYVTVSSISTSGTLSAGVITGPPTPIPPYERCGPGAIDASGGLYLVESLLGFDDDAAGCVGSGYPDAFYRLELTARKRVTAVVSRPSGERGSIYLTLRSACDSAGALACDNGDPTATLLETLDPGTYYLMVEMRESDVGDYLIDVLIRDPL